jgi:hypothetical protein
LTAAAAALSYFNNADGAGAYTSLSSSSSSSSSQSSSVENLPAGIITSKNRQNETSSKSTVASSQKQIIHLACFYCGRFVRKSTSGSNNIGVDGDDHSSTHDSHLAHTQCREKMLQKRGLTAFPAPKHKSLSVAAPVVSES